MVCSVLNISLSSKSFTINCLAKCPKKYSIPFILYLLAFSMATDLAMDPEYQLFVSSKCYEAAYELLVSEPLKDLTSDQLSQVLKRLGNIRNEMGVYYMNQAAAMQAEKEGKLHYSKCSLFKRVWRELFFLFLFFVVYHQPFYSPVPLLVKKSVSAAEQEMWKKSFGFFEKGMKDFEAIGDSTNTALLLCNTGRLMRICAQAHCNLSGDEGRGEFSPEEALYYNKVPH